MVVGPLGQFADAVHKGQRGRKIGKPVVAHDRLALAPPVAAGQPLFDPLVVEEAHRRLSRGRSISGRRRRDKDIYSVGVRIVSLVPHATELLFALGVGSEVIAVTHECDHPAEATLLPQVTRDVLPAELSAIDIDRAVRQRTKRGEAIYELDSALLRDLAPDLIVTQALCPVCAVSYSDVVELAEEMPSQPYVIALDPKTLGEALGDVRTLAQATERRDRGVELIRDAATRIDRVRLAVRAQDRPRVAALEWLDPVFVAGHWTPQLIEIAGGEDVLGFPGEPSQQTTWETVAAARPDVVLIMPCGYDARRAREEALTHAGRLASVANARVVAVNASAYFSRPGPRLVDGLELLAHALHPERVPDPPEPALEVDLRATPA
jgi:iron complex transport system substrate-binding protein